MLQRITFYIDDGHYPRIKLYSEYNKEDVHKILSQDKLEEIGKVIAAIDVTTPTGQPDFVAYLASLIHDRSHDLNHQLY